MEGGNPSLKAIGESFGVGLHGVSEFNKLNRSGVPHVVLPARFDTCDYVQRAEFFSIGVFGNQTCAPGVRADEFSRASVRVTRKRVSSERRRNERGLQDQRRWTRTCVCGGGRSKIVRLSISSLEHELYEANGLHR